MIYVDRSAFDQFPFACLVMDGSQPFMTHCHQEMEMIVVRSGRIMVKNDGECLVLCKGDVWLIPPFVSHSIEGGTPGSQRLAVLVDLKLAGFQGDEGIAEILEQRVLHSGRWPEHTAARAVEIIEEMCAEYKISDLAWKLAVRILLNTLLLLVIREAPPGVKKVPGAAARNMKIILSYIAMNYCDKVSLKACAALVGFHPCYLSRYFKEHMGITFQEYVKRMRIEHAKWLLWNEKLSITEVLYQSGFHDIKTFNKLFKKECLMTPSGFRKIKQEMIS